MKKGDKVYTPRFCTVTIEKIFDNVKDMVRAGYSNDSYYCENGWRVYGKSLDLYHMEFAASKLG